VYRRNTKKRPEKSQEKKEKKTRERRGGCTLVCTYCLPACACACTLHCGAVLLQHADPSALCVPPCHRISLDAESAFHSVGNDGGVEADASPAVEKSRSLFIVGLRKKEKRRDISFGFTGNDGARAD
jgi:hypothetical protein